MNNAQDTRAAANLLAHTAAEVLEQLAPHSASAKRALEALRDLCADELAPGGPHDDTAAFNLANQAWNRTRAEVLGGGL